MPVLTKAATDLIAQRPFGEIHGICDGEHNQSAVPEARPIEKVVHDGLVFGHQLVQLVHEDNARNTAWTRSRELAFQKLERM